jgi:hypothetical protein
MSSKKLWRASVEVEVLIASHEQPSTDQILMAANSDVVEFGITGCDVECYPAVQITKLDHMAEKFHNVRPRDDYGDQVAETCKELLTATGAK